MPRCSPAKNWIATWNNYPADWQTQLQTHLIDTSRVIRLVAQPEVGEEGTPHIQFCIELKKKMRWSSLGLPPTIHWEVTKDVPAARLYCSKEDTRAEGATPFTFGWRPPRPLRLITELRPWQATLKARLLEEPDDRTIYWYWESTGNTGKSAFTKYMCHHHKAMLLSGKGNDVLNAIVKLKDESDEYPDIVIYDVPRSVDMQFISWSAIEMIKNGHFYSGKYEGGHVLMPHPHLLIFSNEPPPVEKVSADRWKITQIPTGAPSIFGNQA